MKKFVNLWSFIFLSALLGMGLFSCVPLNKIKYLQDSSSSTHKNVFENMPLKYHLQPGDYLYIRLFTMDQDANKIFNDMNGGTAYGNTTDQSVYLNSYEINDSGYINFPLLGQIKAGGLYITDVEKELMVLMQKEVNNPGVVVKLANFRFTVLGEVRMPGDYMVNQDRITIYQAISKAGDLTTYANRRKVKLLRKEGGQTNIFNIDVTKKEIITSDYYYLRPGDILYIEPLRSKQFAFETFPYALVLSSLSTIFALITFFKI